MTLKDRATIFLATGAYAGYIPFAPGTFGTLWGVAIAYFIRGIPIAAQGAVVASVFVISVAAAGGASRIFGIKDPGKVVCDEVTGFLAAIFLMPFTPFSVILVFILFRIFDILKPYPVGFLDKKTDGGLGIVLDDVAAGVYANICGHVIIWLLPRLV